PKMLKKALLWSAFRQKILATKKVRVRNNIGGGAMEFLASLEQTPFSVMLRETYFGFILPLTLHSISMGFFIGCTLLISARLLGVGAGIPLTSLSRLMPLL